MKRYWLMAQPTMCELCQRALGDTFIDGATTQGPWAVMCPRCWSQGHGLGGALGTGRGQQYTKQPDGRWLKTAG